MRVEFANTLRGVASLLVVLSHHLTLFWLRRDVAAGYTGLPELPASIATPALVSAIPGALGPLDLGALGVSVFFLISGFVIPFSFVRQSRAQFAIGRFFRIWPTYAAGFLCTVTAICLAVSLTQRPLPFSPFETVPHIVIGLRVLLQARSLDGIVWTLEIELIFYVLAAVLATQMRRASRRTFLAPLIILTVVFAQSLASHLGLFPSGLAVLARYMAKAAAFSPFLIFMLIGTALNFHFRRAQSLVFTAAMVASLFAGFLMSVYCASDLFQSLAPSYTLGLAVFVAARAAPRFMRTPAILRFLADISYPLYVVHAVVGYVLLWMLVAHYRWEPLFAHAAVFAFVLALASALHRIVEIPSQRLGRVLAGRRLRTVPGADAGADLETAQTLPADGLGHPVLTSEPIGRG